METNSSIKVGDIVRLHRNIQVSRLCPISSQIWLGTPTKHNIVDPGPVLEVDGQGNPTSDQYLNPAKAFTLFR